MADCNKELQDSGLTEKAAQDLLDEVQRSGRTAEERIAYAKHNFENADRQARLREFQQKVNAVKMADAESHVAEFPANGHSTWEGLKSFLVGSDKPIKNAQMSVDANLHERVQAINGGLQKDLSAIDPNIYGWMHDKDFDYEVGKAKWMATNEGEYQPRTDVPWGAKVQKVANVYQKYSEMTRQALNNEGADIHMQEHHVMPQSHNTARMLAAGKETWVNTIMPLLDQGQTFYADANPRDVLGKIYDKITDDTWQGYSNDRTSNLANRLSKSRELHFKDYDSYYQYNQQFGSQNIIEGMNKYLQRQARNWGVMEKLGSNPENFISQLVNKYGREAAPPGIGIPFTGKQIPSIKPSIEAIAKTLLGKDNVPGNGDWAKFLMGLRRTQDMAHLGSSFASQIPDVATIGARAKFNGGSFLDGHASAVTSFIKGRSKGELRQIAEEWGIFADSALGHVQQRFGAFDSDTGTFAKAVESFYKLAGITRWDETNREGFGLWLNSRIAREVDMARPFDKLEAGLQTNLQRYGISPEEWGKLDNTKIMDVEGRRFLDANQMSDGLARKFRAMLVSESEKALPLPGAYERAFMLRGMKPGTFGGEMARFFWRYKSVSLTMATRVLPQVWQTGRFGALASFMVESAALGYLSYSARELMQGRMPPDPKNPQTMLQSILHGGGLGFAGDMFLSLGNEMQKSAMDIMGGPTGGILNNAVNLTRSIIHAKPDTAARGFRMLMSEMPMVNLWYSKLALNYLFSWRVQEAMNPGYLSRMEKKMKQSGQGDYFIPPSQVIPYGGFR